MTKKESPDVIFAMLLWLESMCCTNTDVTTIQTHAQRLTHSDVMKIIRGLGAVHWFTFKMTAENHHDLTSEGVFLLLYVIICYSIYLTGTIHEFQLIEAPITIKTVPQWHCGVGMRDSEWQKEGSVLLIREPCNIGAPCSAGRLTPWTGMCCAITRLIQSMQ